MKFCYLVLIALLLANPALAEVTRIRIDERKPFAEGKKFGQTGAYESISGRLFFEVNPKNPKNDRITDLDLAPKNDRGMVEFWSDFFLLQPIDPGRGNGSLLYDVHNRGNKLALWTFNEGERTNDPVNEVHAGNGFLMKEGYSLLWTGWNGDVVKDGTGRLLAGLPVARDKDGKTISARNFVEISVDEKVFSRAFFESPWGTPKAYPTISLDDLSAVLTMRKTRSDPATAVAREDWAFAKYEDGKATPHPTSLYVREGLRPGWLYELVYTARDPRVSGLGLAGLRDAVSFFRYSNSDNPALGNLERAFIFGISQSGRVIHHFLYEGLNRDESNQTIFDGAILHVPGGGKGLFNSRFGMATVYGTANWGNLYPSEFFPFSPVQQTDPITGRQGGSIDRTRKQGEIPKLFFVQTATEYWARAGSLVHTDVEGKKDIKLDPNMRIYHIAGAQHLGGGDTDPGTCRHLKNPMKHRGPVLRALLVAMQDWVSGEVDPPESQYPRIDDGTLVDLETFREKFPKIPGVTPPAYYRPLRLDLGPRWLTEGITDNVPPKIGKPYETLVPAVDSDGNELSGIRLPDVAVPLATYTGWNVRSEEYGAGGILGWLHGGYFEFSKKSNPKDPRPSIQERYKTRDAYFSKYTKAVLALKKRRYLLDEDVSRLINEAEGRDYWSE